MSGTSAENGDFLNIDQVFTMQPGESSASFTLTIFDDDIIEQAETFTLSMVPVSDEDLTVDPAKDELTVTIRDNDCEYLNNVCSFQGSKTLAWGQ